MSLLNVDTIEPEGATTVLTLGSATDTIKIPGGGAGADKVLTSDADGDATWVAPASSGFTRLYEAPSGTYTVPADVTKIVVQCQGAGGSGSSIATYYTGGGGGGFVQGSLTVAAGNTMTVAVGAGGVAIGVGGGAGNVGGATTFTNLSGHAGFTAFSAGGGAGGISSGAGPVAGGAVSGGDFRIRGGRTTLRTNSGQSFWSVGSIGQSDNGADFGYGKGSGAGTDGSYVSGTGGLGLCLIWEYK